MNGPMCSMGKTVVICRGVTRWTVIFAIAFFVAAAACIYAFSMKGEAQGRYLGLRALVKDFAVETAKRGKDCTDKLDILQAMDELRAMGKLIQMTDPPDQEVVDLFVKRVDELVKAAEKEQSDGENTGTTRPD